MQIKTRVFIGGKQVETGDLRKVVLNSVYVDRVINSIVDNKAHHKAS